jgi:hypothetical protein
MTHKLFDNAILTVEVKNILYMVKWKELYYSSTRLWQVELSKTELQV